MKLLVLPSMSVLALPLKRVEAESSFSMSPLEVTTRKSFFPGGAWPFSSPEAAPAVWLSPPAVLVVVAAVAASGDRVSSSRAA